ncbi:MAG: DNA starvation/stationary phase protection protein [Anaerolineae bacterium]|nr:DNA starvation/stationary phase protection protein [Anaerolineae bacterium]
MAARSAEKTKSSVGNTPNIGLSDKAREHSIQLLTTSLADTFVLYTKTRKYHWNVTGMHFMQLHLLFESQYEQLDNSMDEIAERIRQLGGIALGTLAEMQEHTALKEQPGINPDEKGMIADLVHDHETVIQSLREAADAVEEDDDMGTNDFFIGLMQEHEKAAWFLRAHLG